MALSDPAETHRPSLGRADWIRAARQALVEGGVDAVKVDPLARSLEITRGSFYWHFRSRADLLEALIADWRETNTAPMLEAVRRAAERGDPQDFPIVGDLWIEEREYDPRYDSAVRDWARTDPAVAEAVRQVDDLRLEAFTELMVAYGFAGEEALVRARILYFHQIGYYALNVIETAEERRRLGPIYDRVLFY